MKSFFGFFFFLPSMTSNRSLLSPLPHVFSTLTVYTALSSFPTFLIHKTDLLPSIMLPIYFGSVVFIYWPPFNQSTLYSFGNPRIVAFNFTNSLRGTGGTFCRVTSGGPAKITPKNVIC